MRGEINQAFDRWTGVATEFVQGEVLSAQIPFLNVSLAQALNRGFDAAAVTVPSPAAAQSYALDLLTIQTAPLGGLGDLGALASALESQFNAVKSGSPFTVTAGIHDWSELRFDVSFDASRSFAFAQSLSPEITAALGAAGIELSAFSNLDVRTRLGGSVEVGIRLDGLTALNGASGFADRGFLRVHPLSFEVDSNFSGLTVAAGLSAQVFGSPATVNVVNGTVSLDARAELSRDPNGADGSGRFTLAALAAAPAIQFQASGSLDARLPLSATLGQFDLSLPRLALRAPPKRASQLVQIRPPRRLQIEFEGLAVLARYDTFKKTSAPAAIILESSTTAYEDCGLPTHFFWVEAGFDREVPTFSLFPIPPTEVFHKCVSRIGCSIFPSASVILSPDSHDDPNPDKAKFR